MSESWRSDVAAIFVAVVLAELTVLAVQAIWPWFAERVQIQQAAWQSSFATPEEVPSGSGA